MRFYWQPFLSDLYFSYVLRILSLRLIISSFSFGQGFAKFPTSVSTEQYVNDYLLEDILKIVRDEERTDFHLTASDNITFGKPYEAWT